MAQGQPTRYLRASEVRRFNELVLRRMEQRSALLRERGLLESAVMRPPHAAYYEGADLITQAALYMVGIAHNHAFVDANKRTGYLAGMTFLRLNGYPRIRVGLNDPGLGVALERVVGHLMSFEEFVDLLRERVGDISGA